MVQKVIANFDSSKASGPEYCPVVILKNCESYILAEFFNMCLKESCFPDCWKVSLVVSVFKKVKTTALLVFPLWLVKSLQKL